MPLPIKKIAASDANFPPLLKEVKDGPKELYYLGELPQNVPTIAIVGTRKATNDGLLVAKNISYDLAKAGVTIISGLALGIDSAAHEGALAAGGKTVAVLANGVKNIYPRSHYQIAQKILSQNGAVLSEHLEERPYYDAQFLERNRIISGLSIAVVVIEAPIKSGSLSTARHALNQGREVFVCPGRAGHQNYEGSHMLLRNGARIVTSAKDILEDLQETISNFPMPTGRQEFPIFKAEPKEIGLTDENARLVLSALQTAAEPLHIDKLVEMTKLDPNVVSQKLTFLTLDGLVEESRGKFRII